jgi:hypothetical protein
VVNIILGTRFPLQLRVQMHPKRRLLYAKFPQTVMANESVALLSYTCHRSAAVSSLLLVNMHTMNKYHRSLTHIIDGISSYNFRIHRLHEDLLYFQFLIFFRLIA